MNRGGLCAVVEGEAIDGFSAAVDKETGVVKQDRAGKKLASGTVGFWTGREYLSIPLGSAEVKPGQWVRIEAPLIKTPKMTFLGTGRVTHIDGKAVGAPPKS